MSDDLLAYYNKELSYLRHLGDAFGRAHPKIARRLRLDAGASDDPHVERLLEGFAYLSARIRHKLDDDLPEISDALLGVLYPHYQAPVPSLALVQFALDPGQAELAQGYALPAGTALEAEAPDGGTCSFRTCYPVTLWPLAVHEAGLRKPPFTAPVTPFSGKAAAVLRLSLRGLAPALPPAQLELDVLRLYLKGQPQHIYPLYELLHKDTLGVAVAASANDPEPAVLPRSCVRPVGFDRAEGALPYTARSFLGYRLLTEYFTFPEKFLFVDLAGLRGRRPRRPGAALEVYFYLSHWSKDLEQNVTADTFRLGCTPVVNLFAHRADPIELTQTEWEYRVVPDRRRPAGLEVYSVDRVVASSPDGAAVEYRPFFSTRHSQEGEAPAPFWFATRRPSEVPDDAGTEVYLSLVDLNLRPAAPAAWTVTVETTCLNRDLPRQLPYGGDQPRLTLSAGRGPVGDIRCLTPPTPTRRPALKHGAMWRLISHLTLNHLSVVHDGDGAAALREILKLYDFAGSAETLALIDGLRGARAARRGARRPAGPVGRLPRRRGRADVQRREVRRAGGVPVRVRAGAVPGAVLFGQFVYPGRRHR